MKPKINTKFNMSEFYNEQINKHGYWWSGDYPTWDDAEKECTGCSDESILEQVKNILLTTKDREDIYERDGCIIAGEPEYVFELLEWIKKTAINNEINLIDFGGSLGTTFFQLKKYLKDYKVRWNIIEQGNFVTTGKEIFEDDNIKFYYTIDECLAETKPNCFISSSVFPYIKNTEEILTSVFDYKFDWILLDRMSMIDGDKDRLSIQIVPPDIYKAIYPCWFFGEDKFINYVVDNGYEHLKSFDALGGRGFAPRINTSAHRGYIFKKL
jgi:putative methyltransferase (TIGR04325 family)